MAAPQTPRARTSVVASLWLALAFAFALTDVAHAQVLPTTRAWIEVAAFRGPQPVNHGTGTVTYLGTTTVVSPMLGARALLYEQWLFHATIPFVSLFLSEFSQFNSFRIGNPTLDASYLFKLGRRTWMTMGFGTAFPFASAPSEATTNNGAEHALLLGRVLRGGTAAWEYTPHQFTLYFPFELETGTENLRIGIEASVAHSIDTRSDHGPEFRPGGAPFVIGARVQALIIAGLWLGARVNAVALDPEDVPDLIDVQRLPPGTYERTIDNLQVSTEPFAELHLKSLFFGFGVRINLDRPYGFGSEYQTVWSARLSAGAQL